MQKALFVLLCGCPTQYSRRSTLCSAAQQHIQTVCWCIPFLLNRSFLSERSFEIFTKEKTKHFKKSQGDREHSRAHYKVHMPCSRNMTFKSLNLSKWHAAVFQNLHAYIPLCTYINRNKCYSSGTGIWLVAAAW